MQHLGRWRGFKHVKFGTLCLSEVYWSLFDKRLAAHPYFPRKTTAALRCFREALCSSSHMVRSNLERQNPKCCTALLLCFLFPAMLFQHFGAKIQQCDKVGKAMDASNNLKISAILCYVWTRVLYEERAIS